ncbi:MAG: GAF domain-containing protein [Chloroflexi bacterium AL-N10]|nr:GAF domain-containing protein [Chloroflexi bacterium AL-N1]NOK66723.1 GAF domain-containing protein [Chloroflexi bacterium AL-N10]NOK72111.1 GAF domain-containing protein [Chloroflexi bacterium AL-N5]
MGSIYPPTSDLIHLHQQLGLELAQVTDVDAVVHTCLTFVNTHFHPRDCQIVWHAVSGPHVLAAPDNTMLFMPDQSQLEWLATGEFVYIEDARICCVPFRAEGKLLGWMVLEGLQWNTENLATFVLLATQVAPVLAMFQAKTGVDREAHVAQLNTFAEISHLVSGTLDLDMLMDAIYKAVLRVIDAYDFYIALYNPTTDLLELTYAVRNGERDHTQISWMPSQGLTSILIETRAPLYADNYEAECSRHDITPVTFGNFPLGKAWLGAPLFANDRFVGVLIVSSMNKECQYDATDADALFAIGTQVAVAIENARLYRRSETQARQLATLNHITRTITSSLDPKHVPSLIMKQVSELFDAEEGSLLLIDENTDDLVFAYTNGRIGTQLLGQRLPRGTGVAGYVAIEGQSVIVNDVQHDSRFYADTDRETGFQTRNILAVPLRGVVGIQGVIEVLNRRNGRAFTEDDRFLLEAIADQAVIALENAEQFAQVDQALAWRAQELTRSNEMLQHNLRSLTALNALGMAINTSLRNAHEIFGMTAHGVVEITGAVGASILLSDDDGIQLQTAVGIPQPMSAIEPFVERVLRTNRPEVVLCDHLESARSVLAVPLRATRRTLGVLCVYFADQASHPSDQETVVLFATQAAAAAESIELFTAVRSARDQMASILASTREGILLIGSDSRIAIANAALSQLCGISGNMLNFANVSAFLTLWQETAGYDPDEWEALKRGIDTVMYGQLSVVAGELSVTTSSKFSIEWTVLPVLGSKVTQGSVILVLRDITEAKVTERIREDLTHMMVHDLRAPLTSVIASIELLSDDVPGKINPTQQNILDIALASSNQMLAMVDTLLDINRLESGHMPLELSFFQLSIVSSRAVERLNSLAHERKITIEENISTELPDLYADEALITRVLQNLLSNAIKFGRRRSTVVVQATLLSTAERSASSAHKGKKSSRTKSKRSSQQPTAIRIEIRDQGVGIAPEDQEKIFTKFGQVGERRGGNGLGLTFCKLVVEAHGGQIGVESTPGEGSTFFFVLPVVTNLHALPYTSI